MNALTPFEKVSKLIGSYSAIGAIFTPPVSPQAISKWEKGGIPHDRVLTIAQATQYAVTPHEMRPDIYPHPDDGLPMSMRSCSKQPPRARAAA